MDLIATVDKMIWTRFRTIGGFKALDVQLNYLGNAEMGGPERSTLNYLRSIDAKVAPLLAHVSIMIAALVVLLATLHVDKWKQYVIAVEIALYVFVAMGSLCCIHSTIPDSKTYSKYENVEDRRSLREETQVELAVKILIFAFVNKLAIYLTAFLLISTPLIIVI
jgi:hypothetical protein